jgi:RNA polymerase sigma-B factor
MALRYAYTGEPIDDLVQVASLGLVKAIDRFDPERGTSVPAYAVPTILGELKRYFRDVGWSVNVARELQERARAVSREYEALSHELGRSPKPREVAEGMNLSVEEVLEAQDVAVNYAAASLDVPAARDEEESAALVDLLGTEESGYDLVEDRAAIARTWQALPDLEREILKLRFVSDMTQRQIGEVVNYSQMHVSRLLRRALGRLTTAADPAA